MLFSLLHWLPIKHFKFKSSLLSWHNRNSNSYHLLLATCVLSSWRRQWQATPVLLPRKSHGWRSLVGYSPWGRQESVTTEWLHFHFSLSRNGEGNGNPLQCSCLENPRDGRAWWAAVYGVEQSWTQLKQLSSSSSSSSTKHHVGFCNIPSSQLYEACTLISQIKKLWNARNWLSCPKLHVKWQTGKIKFSPDIESLCPSRPYFSCMFLNRSSNYRSIYCSLNSQSAFCILPFHSTRAS